MSVSDSDVSAAEALTNRAVRAFMTSRVLLTCSQAPVQAKASLFQSLVESTFKWVAGSALGRFSATHVPCAGRHIVCLDVGLAPA